MGSSTPLLSDSCKQQVEGKTRNVDQFLDKLDTAAVGAEDNGWSRVGKSVPWGDSGKV